jgi:hypothetical protein
MTHLRHAKLTYELRGLIFEARKKLKTGWPEEVYHSVFFSVRESRVFLRIDHLIWILTNSDIY